MKNQIFISYRRDGGDVTAKLICEALKNKGYSVFYDYDSLKGGVFDSRILESIDECNDVVLVLPKKALARCKDKKDWVRQEIRYALQTEKNIIPVMLDGFEFPKKLPDDIRDVARYNGVRFHMDFFETVIDKIIERLITAPQAGSPIPQTSEQQQLDFTDNVAYRVFLNVSHKGGSYITFHSPESSKSKHLKYHFTEQDWQQFVGVIKPVISVLLHISDEMISVERKSPVGIKKCAPSTETCFDAQYRIDFSTSFLLDAPPKLYDSIHFEISNQTVRLTLFDKGNYVFHHAPADAKLSYFDIDEKVLIQAAKPLVAFAEHSSNIQLGVRFQSEVYSDKSGGYYLSYLK